MPALYAQASCFVLGVAPDDVLGGAVRHGAGRGDGRARADRRGGQRRDPRGRRRQRGPCSRPATGSACADALERRAARQPPGARRAPGAGAARAVSAAAAAERLRAAYERLLAMTADVVIVPPGTARDLLARCLEHLARRTARGRDRRRQRLGRRDGASACGERFPGVHAGASCPRTSASGAPSTRACAAGDGGRDRAGQQRRGRRAGLRRARSPRRWPIRARRHGRRAARSIPGSARSTASGSSSTATLTAYNRGRRAPAGRGGSRCRAAARRPTGACAFDGGRRLRRALLRVRRGRRPRRCGCALAGWQAAEAPRGARRAPRRRDGRRRLALAARARRASRAASCSGATACCAPRPRRGRCSSRRSSWLGARPVTGRSCR